MKSVCERRYEGEERGGASRELKILGQIFLYFLSLSLFALLWVNVRLCWELAGTAYYKNLNLKHLPPSMPKCIKSRIWRIICMYAAPCAPVPAAEPLPWQLTRPRAGPRGCCPRLNLQLQSLVSCMMEMNHYHCSMKEHNLALSQLLPYGPWFAIASEDRLCIQSTIQLSAFRPPRWKAWGIHEINRDKLITTPAYGNSVWPGLL